MPKIRYRKTEPGAPDTVEAFGGLTFDVGKWVDVDDRYMAKAKGNPTFEVQGEKTFGDDGTGAGGSDVDEEERRARAEIARQGQEETKKAKQAEARGVSHRDDRA